MRLFFCLCFQRGEEMFEKFHDTAGAIFKDAEQSDRLTYNPPESRQGSCHQKSGLWP